MIMCVTLTIGRMHMWWEGHWLHIWLHIRSRRGRRHTRHHRLKKEKHTHTTHQPSTERNHHEHPGPAKQPKTTTTYLAWISVRRVRIHVPSRGGLRGRVFFIRGRGHGRGRTGRTHVWRGLLRGCRDGREHLHVTFSIVWPDRSYDKRRRGNAIVPGVNKPRTQQERACKERKKEGSTHQVAMPRRPCGT